MRIVIYDDEHESINGRELEADAFVIGTSSIESKGYASQCFMAGQGAVVLRALNAVITSVAEKPDLIQNFLAAKFSGALDTTSVREENLGDEEGWK